MTATQSLLVLALAETLEASGVYLRGRRRHSGRFPLPLRIPVNWRLLLAAFLAVLALLNLLVDRRLTAEGSPPSPPLDVWVTAVGVAWLLIETIFFVWQLVLFVRSQRRQARPADESSITNP